MGGDQLLLAPVPDLDASIDHSANEKISADLEPADHYIKSQVLEKRSVKIMKMSRVQ